MRRYQTEQSRIPETITDHKEGYLKHDYFNDKDEPGKYFVKWLRFREKSQDVQTQFRYCKYTSDNERARFQKATESKIDGTPLDTQLLLKF